MMTDQDKNWLHQNYPGLKFDQGIILGKFQFIATYNNQTNQFLILGDNVENTIGGHTLDVCFNIRIQERIHKSTSNLPSVHVEGVDPIPNRHFNPMDKSACLCSPLEEELYLIPQLQFIRFMEELVVPFLYGQLFYSTEGRWPWQEYEHGATGILESYCLIDGSAKLQECLQKLSLDRNAWQKIKAIISQQGIIKGHTPCVCSKKDNIKRCHHNAWLGIIKLQRDVKQQGLMSILGNYDEPESVLLLPRITDLR